jgi:hypothetical protein
MVWAEGAVFIAGINVLNSLESLSRSGSSAFDKYSLVAAKQLVKIDQFAFREWSSVLAGGTR